MNAQQYREGLTPASGSELERGGDDTIDVVSIPEQFDEDERASSIHIGHQRFSADQRRPVYAYLSRASELPISSVVGVALIDKALSIRAQSKDSATALSLLRSMAPKDFGFATWTEAESSRLDTMIGQMGEDLEGIAASFSKKSQNDVVRYFYMFKGCDESSAL